MQLLSITIQTNDVTARRWVWVQGFDLVWHNLVQRNLILPSTLSCYPTFSDAFTLLSLTNYYTWQNKHSLNFKTLFFWWCHPFSSSQSCCLLDVRNARLMTGHCRNMYRIACAVITRMQTSTLWRGKARSEEHKRKLDVKSSSMTDITCLFIGLISRFNGIEGCHRSN